MKTVFHNQFTYYDEKDEKTLGRRTETPFGESLTDPSFVQPMENLIDRAQRGRAVSMLQGVFIEDDLDFSEVSKMTIQEKMDLRRSIDNYQNQTREKLREAAAIQKEKEAGPPEDLPKDKNKPPIKKEAES